MPPKSRPTKSSAAKPNPASESNSTSAMPPLEDIPGLSGSPPGSALTLDPPSRGRGRGSTGRGGSDASRLKYRPKTQGRRSAQERARIEQEERERAAARTIDANAAYTGSSGLRGRGAYRARGYINTRGRGPYGRGGTPRGLGMPPPERIGLGMASGPFGAGSLGTATKRKMAIPGLKREMNPRHSSEYKSSAMAKAKRRSSHGESVGAGSDFKDEASEGRHDSSDDDVDGEVPRVDIEYINLISDDEQIEEEPGKPQRRPSHRVSRGLRPIRLDAKEHADRGTVVSVDAQWGTGSGPKSGAGNAAHEDSVFAPLDAKPDKVRRRGKEKAGEVQFVRDARKWKGVYPEDEEQGEVEVKDEPVDETELMAVDDATAPEAPLGAGLAVSGAAESASESQEAKAKAKTKGRSRVKTEDQPVLHTEQDRLEWATKEQDIQMLTAELGRMPPDLASTEPEVDKGGDVSSDTPETGAKDPKFGRLYLLQFPPILPGLYNPVTREGKDAVAVETVPSATDVDSARVQSAPGGRPIPPPTAAAPDRPSKATEEVIVDEAAEGSGAQEADHPRLLTPNARGPDGLVGKLRVHASGKVALRWGNGDTSDSTAASTTQAPSSFNPTSTSTSTPLAQSTLQLLVHRGTDVEFLQDVVLAHVNPTLPSQTQRGLSTSSRQEDKKAEHQVSGLACGIAQIAGKFIVTPDWEKLLK